ncbi:MAG: hypothetical protein Fur009_7410 [Candidatus Microgenomates bacterium]
MNPKKPLSQQPQNVRDDVALLSFIDELIAEKKDSNINEKNIAAVRMTLLENLKEMIYTRLVSMLSLEKQKELQHILDNNGKDEEIDQLFGQNIPNIEAVIASVMLDFKIAYLAPFENKTEFLPPVPPTNFKKEN